MKVSEAREAVLEAIDFLADPQVLPCESGDALAEKLADVEMLLRSLESLCVMP